MANSFRPARRSTGRRNLFFVTILAIVIILLDLSSGGRIAAGVRDVVAPISETGGKLGALITRNGYFSSRAALEAQIAALQAEVQQDQLQTAAFQVMQQENTSLTALTHLAQTSPGLAAAVTSSVISSPYGTFTIGAGSADGVGNGALVLTSDGFVVGTVTQAQTHRSVVTELFAPGAQTPVTIAQAAAVASGQGNDAQAQLPNGVSVADGTPVIASSYGGKPVGIVQYVSSDPADAQETLYIALPVSLASLEYVYITP